MFHDTRFKTHAKFKHASKQPYKVYLQFSGFWNQLFNFRQAFIDSLSSFPLHFRFSRCLDKRMRQIMENAKTFITQPSSENNKQVLSPYFAEWNEKKALINTWEWRLAFECLGISSSVSWVDLQNHFTATFSFKGKKYVKDNWLREISVVRRTRVLTFGAFLCACSEQLLLLG